MSGILLLVVMPAVLSFIFATFVMYYSYVDVQERLDYYFGFPDRVRINVPGS